MSKITRAFQRIFCGDVVATNNVAQFGSLKAAAIVYSKTIGTIQSLDAFGQGWSGAVVTNQAPAMQDLNALFFLTTSQLAYLMQAGVAEWEATTTYYIGSLVSDGLGRIFYSLVDTNLNQNLTDKTKWLLVNEGLPWSATLTYQIGQQVRSADGLLVYASIADANLNHAVTDPAYWRPVVMNGTAAATGGTTTATCDCQLADTFTCASTGNITITMDHIQDGKTYNVLLSGANARTVAWTLLDAASSTLGAAKTGITYSNTMTNGLSMFTLSRIGSSVYVNSLHGIS